MAGRDELYLKHIDENTGRIAKVLEKVLTKIEHYESKDEYDDTVNTLIHFASYYEENAVTEVERRKAKDLRRAVDSYIDLMEGRKI